MKKILVVRYGTIGDSVFASAFYRELRRALPDAQIDAFVDVIAKGVMENCPYIDNLVDIKRKYKDLKYYISLFKKYDTVYFLKNDSFFTRVAFFAGVKNRIGFDIGRNKFLTHKAPYTEDRHEIDCYLDLLRITGIQPQDDSTEVWLKEQSEAKAMAFLADTKEKKVLIQAFSRFPQKNWINAYWVELIKYLSEELDMQVYYSGGKKDIEAYKELSEAIGEIKHKPIDLSSELSINETAAFIKHMDLVIGIDSCNVHIAAAFDVETILIHGATSLKRWRPRSEKCTVLSKFYPCSPCLLQHGAKKYCRGIVPKCMRALTASDIIFTLKQKKPTEIPKVSVVVSVYNAEKYVARCLDSIINQTMQDIEIICINDGSKDFSLEILKEYEKRDKRIKIITRENKGISATRNLGIDTAIGEYIAFIDSDDWISPNFCEKLYDAAKRNDSDIVAASITCCRRGEQQSLIKYECEKVFYDFNDKLKVCDIPSHCYVWNKIYRRANLNTRFDNGRIYEDVSFTPIALYNSNKLTVVPDAEYFYFRHSNSLVKIQTKKSKDDFIYARNKMNNFLSEHGIDVSQHTSALKKYKLFGLTLLKTIQEKDSKKYILLNLIRWRTKK